MGKGVIVRIELITVDSEVEIENIKTRGKEVSSLVEGRDIDIEKQEIESKIREARYNPKYREIMVEGLPNYLRSYRKGNEMALLARMKCGNLEEYKSIG